MSKTPGKDLVFIASGGRTGTTFFGEVLGKVIGDSFSAHEPDVMGKIGPKFWEQLRRFGIYQMLLGKMIGATGLRPVGHRLLAGQISEQDGIARVRKMRQAYHAEIDAPLVIESAGRWWMLVDVIGKAWPGAKTVGVIRDPRDWIESWRRHQPARHARLFPRWFPQGPLKPADMGDTEWIDRWKDLDIFGRLAWDWRAITMHLDRAQDNLPNVRVFRFEDLFDQNGKAFGELVDYVATHGDHRYPVGDLDGVTGEVRNASRGAARSWTDWPDEEIRLVEEMCGPLMRKYGYGDEPEWTERVQRAMA